MQTQIEVRWPLDPELGKDFLRTGYIRRNEDRTIEFGVAKKNGEDYAWSVVPIDEFKAAIPLLFPEMKFDG